MNSNANVYVSRAAFEKHYNAKNKYIGLDEELCGNNRLIPVDSELQLAPQIRIMNCQSQRLITPIEPFGLTVMKENALIPENFRHEQYLEIRFCSAGVPTGEFSILSSGRSRMSWWEASTL